MKVDIRKLSQPVTEKKQNGFCFLEYEKTDMDVLMGMQHLSGVLDTFRKTADEEGNFRFILEGGTRETALQVAAALSSFLSALDETEGDEFEWNFCNEEKERYRWLILNQEYFERFDAFNRAINMIDWADDEVDIASSIFVECEQEIGENFPEKIKDLEKDIVIIWVRETRFHAVTLERLIFEQDFQLLKIENPSLAYYTSLFRQYLNIRGFPIENEKWTGELVEELMRFRNQYFREKDIFRYADLALERMRNRNGKSLQKADFCLRHIREKHIAEERLGKMVGLKTVKDQLEKVCAVRSMQERMGRRGEMYHHLAFAGAPGTGKSEAALAYSEILAQERVTNGAFVKAARSDLIGEYVGHTAPKLRQLFDRADGGVLFIDEAGSLTEDDVFTQEAVTELVRYMEERPQTTVIFASYPDKIEELLNRDAGLRSRVSRIISFPSYTEEELMEILKRMAAERGYRMTGACRIVAKRYLEQMRSRQGENFGNAREVRKLLEATFQNYCVRALRREKQTGEKQDLILKKTDFEKAVLDLLPEEKKASRTIGFERTIEKGERRV